MFSSSVERESYVRTNVFLSVMDATQLGSCECHTTWKLTNEREISRKFTQSVCADHLSIGNSPVDKCIRSRESELVLHVCRNRTLIKQHRLWKVRKDFLLSVASHWFRSENQLLFFFLSKESFDTFMEFSCLKNQKKAERRGRLKLTGVTAPKSDFKTAALAEM